MTIRIRHGLVVAAAALFISSSLSGCKGEAPEPPVMPVEYTVVSAREEALAIETELPGRTAAFNISEVRPQITGIVLERLFEQGDTVEKGQPLYQIDPALYQAAVDSAEAALQKARANAQAAGLLARRYKEILGSKAVSKQDYDNAVAAYSQAQAEVNLAKAALDTARINLGYTRITAPIAGRIGRSVITSGALVTQNQGNPLATIQQLDPIYVDVTQSNTELLRLRRAYASGFLQSSGENAAKVKLYLPDGTLYGTPDGKGEILPTEGRLLFSEVSVDQSTGSVTLRAVFPNPDGMLMPGMFVRAVVEEGMREGAVLVPQKAVGRNSKGDSIVYKLVKNSTLESVPDVFNVLPTRVDVDRDVAGGFWLLKDGLHPGDLIMTDGMLRLQPGKPVRAPGAAEKVGNAAPTQPATPSGGKE